MLFASCLFIGVISDLFSISVPPQNLAEKKILAQWQSKYSFTLVNGNLEESVEEFRGRIRGFLHSNHAIVLSKLTIWKCDIYKYIICKYMFIFYEIYKNIFFIKLNMLLSYDPAISPLGYLPRRNEDVCPQKDLHKNVPSSFLHMSPKQGTSRFSSQEIR